jgi:trk system potassium uptake protein TrkA
MKYLVIGLGTYGRELAINLSLQGNEVIGVDHRSENIEAVKEQLMTVYELDAKDENSLKLLPL